MRKISIHWIEKKKHLIKSCEDGLVQISEHAMRLGVHNI